MLGPGTVWSGGLIPDDKYLVNVSGEQSGETGFRCMAEVDNPLLEALLLWVYHKHCFYVEGDDVAHFEQTVYIVKSQSLQHSPEWMCELQVFNVWDQEVQRVTFKIKQ